MQSRTRRERSVQFRPNQRTFKDARIYNQALFAVIVETTNTRLDNIVKEIQSIKTSLEYSQAEIADLQKMNCQDKLD